MFTYDITTTTGKIRFLVGDIASASPNFQDEEIQAVMNITAGQLQGPLFQFGDDVSGNEVLFYVCASLLDALAARVASSNNGRTYRISDFELTGKDQVAAIQDAAQKFRDAINNMPAWGIIEENNCGFNELTIIRNWILRSEF